MAHALVTIVAPLDPARIGKARQAIAALENPARPELAAKLATLDDGMGIHFISLHALESHTRGKAYLLLEFSADGDDGAAIKRLARLIGPDLVGVFRLASDWRDTPMERYLAKHTITSGYGLGANPGLPHIGSPGMSVGRILREQQLFEAAGAVLAGQAGGLSALERLGKVRAKLAGDFADLETLPSAPPPFTPSDIASTVAAGLGGFVRLYLWPWLFVLTGAWLVAMVAAWYDATELRAWALTVSPSAVPPGDRWWLLGDHGTLTMIAHLGVVGLAFAVKFALLFVVVLLVVVGVLYVRFRRQEASDWVSERSPHPATLQEIHARENPPGYALNHMISLTERKPGWLRYFTSRFAFFTIATAGAHIYKPGHLGEIGTIHFARWVTVPGTRDLIFVSNYGGSWESYLEDFITLAHDGLTGVWSNTIGFPRSTNLFAEGATDGERFKRYARQSMLPTLFWYSAYPGLTTDMIRANAAIRRGFSGAMTEDAAQLWLSHFGSTSRPAKKLVTNEIQALVFGGLGFLPAATATFWRMPPNLVDARTWLGKVKEHIAWNDGRRVRDDASIRAIVQLGLSANGLAALGLPGEGLATFPAAFCDGMEARSRILGDALDSDPAKWKWGGPIDAVLVVYGETRSARNALRAELDRIAKEHGAGIVHEIPLRDLPNQKSVPVKVDEAASGNARHDPQRHDPEPFGFADGISQPLIQGTYKAERAQAHPLHVVAPGEFVLGYPDNRGNRPPGPTLSAIHDPANILPVVPADGADGTCDVNLPRDLGCNGTFLVIRQLEQDVGAFKAYCRDQAAKLTDHNRLPPPYHVTPEFIGAKMVGRWQNGAPLVRASYSESKSPAIIAENAFMPGFEDPEGLRCPFGAHIRRASPRDSLNPGSPDQVEISNRHRMLRVGRKYRHARGENPGILFMCLNGDLERQFEFVQQTWLNGNVISLSCPTNLSGETDPILAGGAENSGFTIPTRDGPVKLDPLKKFVTMRGGGYFFLPGKRLVTYLSQSL